MLEYTSGHTFYGEYNDNSIKQSRKTRKEKLEVKQFYHRKNPKSIAFYEEQKNHELTEVLPQASELYNIHSQLDILNKNTDNILIIDILTNKETEKSMKLHDSILPENNSTVAVITKNKPRNKYKAQKKATPKYQNVLEGFASSLEKVFKKDGVFLLFNSSKGYVTVLKDFHVSTTIGKIKANLSLRCSLGNFSLKEVALSCNNSFSELKAEFGNWLISTVNNYNAEEDFNAVFNPLIHNIESDKILSAHLPNLESKLVNFLRKSSKQPLGFKNKLEQIVSSWSEEAKELYYIEQVENQLNFKSFEQSFPLARSLKRKFSIYIGKTNSGKTYAAMNALAEGNSGVYLAPLRLMAQEGQESLTDRKVLTNLVTGEEQKKFDSATHVSSTVEMCNMSKPVDVAVIDEIQMIADTSRGWAWSQALVGVPAKHVILVGSEESLPFIIPIIESLGEEYEIQRFERKTPLHIHDGLKKFKELKAGDCVVVFSRKSALEMKNAIEASGKKCSVIYGNLSPDVRRLEASKFKSGENPILVATDAIGMGLNLPISRLFFSSLEKFDGMEQRFLNVSELKQIAGRAGRYGFAEFGEVGLLMNNSYQDRTLLHKAVYGGYEETLDTRVPIAPNLKQIETICATIGKEDLYAALIFFKEKMVKGHQLYKTANLEDMIEIAALLKNKNFDLANGLTYACVPIDTEREMHTKNFFKWVNYHLQNKEIPAPSLPDVIELEKNDSFSLYEAENYVKLCMAYRWLHYKYPEVYCDIETVIENAQITNTYIEKTLHHHVVMSKNPRWKR